MRYRRRDRRRIAVGALINKSRSAKIRIASFAQTRMAENGFWWTNRIRNLSRLGEGGGLGESSRGSREDFVRVLRPKAAF